jgi:hypothetical protein
MINQRNSRISLATFIFCLCLGSLVALAFIQVNPFASGISGVDGENYNLFNQAEFDDDLSVVSIVGAKIGGLNFSMSTPINLDFQSTCLSPVSPPPKSR